ncbi:MAG: hypothetical protein A2504_15215 [Bdellovibrionales bacterium RIFOXYD12_FULL_39_22]|nr:MAG: hypothetical protein A2385_02645 [Bdellovibrionales bacterium RIFOXYB1_FULL_39_21]OFZ43145.1 MAG: hypothetical protein A2485_11790 [Bdellovibrionales bacterium RIFOXYC12_FULL_39_17]OFZ47883.1 MAG: hypothetical protein A2404_16430 [Bdellovibrionales bacterium RIFOXYC1_FULL_39_130]OFZ69956.1 MAG: hypothetical protein A2451_07820 [Bdellovibrionales bacterium RIFOXYC2_FULL_39_8]OFZ75663.1 MAG: hypothetical protein A2560_12930 [Bdellovibrionales bacterium RIFOXYD1_FULL_39_84]OFZ94153.1 MAG:
MRLNKALEDKLMDVRLRDKLIADGKISKAQVEQYIKSLKDCSETMTYTDKVKKDSKKDQE